MSVCNWCGAERVDCRCRHMPFASTKTFKGTFTYNKFPYALGVEIELSDWGSLEDKLMGTDKYYSLYKNLNAIKEFDRSVTPSNYELVVGPLVGDAFLSNMSKLINLLSKSNCKVNNSCSVHTHVDARDISMWELRSAIRNYMRHENDFVKMFPPSRIYNPNSKHDGYAKMLNHNSVLYAKLQGIHHSKSTSQIKKVLLDYLYNIKNPENNFRDVVRSKSHKYEECRYYGFNLHAYMMRGTYEFRHHEGALDDSLILWPLFVGHYSRAITKYTRSTKEFLPFTECYLPKPLHQWCVDRTDKFKEEWKRNEEAPVKKNGTQIKTNAEGFLQTFRRQLDNQQTNLRIQRNVFENPTAEPTPNNPVWYAPQQDQINVDWNTAQTGTMTGRITGRRTTYNIHDWDPLIQQGLPRTEADE